MHSDSLQTLNNKHSTISITIAIFAFVTQARPQDSELVTSLRSSINEAHHNIMMSLSLMSLISLMSLSRMSLYKLIVKQLSFNFITHSFQYAGGLDSEAVYRRSLGIYKKSTKQP